MGRFAMAAALALLAAPAQAGVEVTSEGGRIDVKAAQAPLSEVLDGLARQTRMKVVYDGGMPRTPVTVDLRGRTPAEAVLGVLEGLGVNYMLALDLSGTQVETLMIVGGGALSGAPPSSMAASSSAMRVRRGRGEAPPPEESEGQDPVEYEAPPVVVPEAPKVEPPPRPSPSPKPPSS